MGVSLIPRHHPPFPAPSPPSKAPRAPRLRLTPFRAARLAASYAFIAFVLLDALVGILPNTFSLSGRPPTPRRLLPRAAFVRAWGARDTACMAPRASWGPPTRVVQAVPAFGDEAFATPPLFVYSDALVAADPACARITTTLRSNASAPWGGRARWATPPPTASEEHTELDGTSLPRADGENDRIVLATHTSVDPTRLDQLVRLERAWGGCLSIALWVCDEVDWEMAQGLHVETEGLRLRATFHAVLGWPANGSKSYPIPAPYPNAMRNAPLAPFAPWGAFPTPPSLPSPTPTPAARGGGGDAPPPTPAEAAAASAAAAATAAIAAVIEMRSHETHVPAQPRPWVLVADADAMPSVSEAVLRRWVAAGLGGKLTVPPSHLEPMNFDIGHRIAGSRHLWFELGWPEQLPTMPKPQCDAWDGKPEPMTCDPTRGAPDGRVWAKRADILDRADILSRCGRVLDPDTTIFVVPSFDIDHQDCIDDPERLPMELKGKAPVGSLPSRALQYIIEHLGTRRITFQAWMYPPAYGGLMLWSSWLRQPGTAGVLPLHYSFLHEPYFIIKAPLPRTLPGRGDLMGEDGAGEGSYTLFDEGYRSMWFDKASLHADLAAGGDEGGGGGAFSLQVLPHVYLFNAHCGMSASAPHNDADFKRKDAAYKRLVASVTARGLACRDLCPCVPINHTQVALDALQAAIDAAKPKLSPTESQPPVAAG